EKYYLDNYGYKIDESCKDVSRARYVSHDPELFINTHSKIFKDYIKEPKEKEKLKVETNKGREEIKQQVEYVINQIEDRSILIGEIETEEGHIKDKYNGWMRICFAFANEFGEGGRDFFHKVSKISSKYNQKDCDDQYDKCLKSNGEGITIATFFHYAKEAGLETTVPKTKKCVINDIKTLIDSSVDELKQLPVHEIRTRHRSGKRVFKPLREARIFKEGKHLIFLNQQILMYQDGWYQEFDDRYYLKLIEKQIEDSFNGRRNKAKEILDVLKDNLYKKTQRINVKPKLINVRNGILNIDNFELLPHTPEEIFTYQINANYNPESKCERFERFLKEVLVKEDGLEPDYEIIRIIQQYIGYCLYTKTPFHECMMLYGVGRNGKSVLVFVIIELFKGLISQVHFEDIGEDRFATADLAGKLVNVSGEFGVNARISDGRIKGIIAGDELRAQRKHQPAFDFRPFAKHIITTNNLPRSRDKSLGFFSRFMIIPFHRIFLKQKEIDNLEDEGLKEICLVRNTFLEQELKAELDGIFLWAVYGLKDLLQNKGFCYSEQVEKLKNTFKVRCSSVESFMDERVDNSDCMANIELPKLYREYILYCKEYHIPPEPKKRFDSSIKDLA
ncbi:MAG: ATPase, partial [Candidatus Scalindua rubra]